MLPLIIEQNEVFKFQKHEDTELKHHGYALGTVHKKLPLLAYWHDMLIIEAIEMHAFVNEHALPFTTAANDVLLFQ